MLGTSCHYQQPCRELLVCIWSSSSFCFIFRRLQRLAGVVIIWVVWYVRHATSYIYIYIYIYIVCPLAVADVCLCFHFSLADRSSLSLRVPRTIPATTQRCQWPGVSMFSFHKPKIYRSIKGCCICRAKSSSSRFTDSKRYEHDFDRCFKIKEHRAGEICNACVLLVKRWKKLPSGSTRNWHHVSRALGRLDSDSRIQSYVRGCHLENLLIITLKRVFYGALPNGCLQPCTVDEEGDMFTCS